MPVMMTVRQIRLLKNLGVFHDFSAPTDLQAFRRYNLIYGFNGSGKTILSRVFGSIEKGALRAEIPDGGVFEVELSNGTVIKSSGALDELKGRLLVFNEDFIEEKIRWKEGTAESVFYIGKQAELSKVLKDKEDDIGKLSGKKSLAEIEHRLKERAFGEHKRDAARLIAEQLILGRLYDATNLAEDYAKRSDVDYSVISEVEQKDLRFVISQDAPLDKRDLLDETQPELSSLIRKVQKILETSLGRIALEDLSTHETMLKWIKEGLEYHREHKLSSCLFCGSGFRDDRLNALARAIDEKFDQLTRDISENKTNAIELRELLADLERKIPSTNDISKNIQSRFVTGVHKLKGLIEVGMETIKTLEALLEKKLSVPNILVDAENLMSENVAREWDTEIRKQLDVINDLIKEHNTAHDEFKEEQEKARTKLKAHFLADGKNKYLELEADAAAAKATLDSLEAEHRKLVGEAEELKTSMRQHGPAAEKINQMIHNYLGHKELEITPLEDGYQLRRNNISVTGSLSEGEKTAIALCYFLSTIEADGRKLKDLIVVVDDPVSSLDTRALNYAFNMIKSALDSACQLIVLTHNLNFMNEAKKWLKNKTEKEVGEAKAVATLFFIETTQDTGTGTRSSSIKVMPKLILQYESEYHYLFSLILKFSHSSCGDNGHLYVMPNILRKVLEIFLAFKRPGSEGLSNKLENVAKEEPELDFSRLRALDRLVQVESHADSLDDLVTFSSMTFEETKAAADALLKLIETCDGKHYTRMCSLCSH